MPLVIQRQMLPVGLEGNRLVNTYTFAQSYAADQAGRHESSDELAVWLQDLHCLRCR